MGTTVVAVLLSGPRIHIGHVGDSRLLLQARQAEQTHEGYSMVQDLVDRGLYTEEQARAASVSHILTRSVGLKFRSRSTLLRQSFNRMTCCYLLRRPHRHSPTGRSGDLEGPCKPPRDSRDETDRDRKSSRRADNISVILAHACAD